MSYDYDKIVVYPKEFIRNKRRRFANYEKVIVDKRTLSLMTTEMIQELLEFKNVDTNFIKEFLEKDILTSLKNNKYDFNKIFSHLLEGNYSSFNGVDYIYFNVIIDECEKNESLKKHFIDFVYRILFNTQELDEDEVKIVKNALYSRMKMNTILIDDYKKLFYSPSVLKTMFYLKFGKTSNRMDYLIGISFKQIMLLNIKHVNQILKTLKIINAVRYANSDLEELENFRLCRRYEMTYCIYNDDWYIVRIYDGNIYGDYLEYDERAITEYTIALEAIKNRFCDQHQQNDLRLVKKLY